jgi:hypothetical protein
MARTRSDPAYTLVKADGSPDYVAPRDSTCQNSVRYMVVHLIEGGGWGIVDRRRGRLLSETRPGEHRYASWTDVQGVVTALNAG